MTRQGVPYALYRWPTHISTYVFSISACLFFASCVMISRAFKYGGGTSAAFQYEPTAPATTKVSPAQTPADVQPMLC